MGLLPFVVMGAVLVATFAGFVAFLGWRRKAARRLIDGGVSVRTARGSIECAFAGPADAFPVLVLHGGLGGWDQGLMLAEDLGLPERCRVIAPSRPGYLRTPLDAGTTTNDAADAMAALLDALAIATAVVVGVSGGGPTALAVAARHPQRVRALVMVCAISHRHLQPAITTEAILGRLLFSDAGGWLLDLGSWAFLQWTRIAPARATRRLLEMTELSSREAIRARVRELRVHPRRLRWVSRLLAHSSPISLRLAGLSNDLGQFALLGERIDARLACPVFVVHGRIDGNVPVAHAQAVLAASDRTESLIIDDASHLLWLHPRCDEIRGRLQEFLVAECGGRGVR